jgi:hypothetical protein
MPGTTPRGIRHPDAATFAKNLGAELATMANDLDTYVGTYAVRGPAGKDGTNGTNGKDGAEGKQGAQGNSAPDVLPTDQALSGWLAPGATSLLKTAVTALIDLVRPQRTYVWANGAAREAQRGMTVDSRGYQTDLASEYRWDGTAWRLWNLSWRPWANPSVSVITIGNGTIAGSYCMVNGVVFLDLIITFGSNSSMGAGSPVIVFPFGASTTYQGLAAVNANAMYLDSGNNYYVAMAIPTSNGLILATPAANGSSMPLGPTVPLNWSPGDGVYVTASYRPIS